MKLPEFIIAVFQNRCMFWRRHTQSRRQVSLSLPCEKVVLRPEQEQRCELCWGQQRIREIRGTYTRSCLGQLHGKWPREVDGVAEAKHGALVLMEGTGQFLLWQLGPGQYKAPRKSVFLNMVLILLSPSSIGAASSQLKALPALPWEQNSAGSQKTFAQPFGTIIAPASDS